jgi:glucose repression regulatory protein TUP1
LPPAGASTQPSVLASASGQRLNEILDLVRNEFETASQDGTVWKAQRDEYEAKSESARSRAEAASALWRDETIRSRLTFSVQQQIAELTLIRQSLYDLENTHQKVRQE